MDNRDRDEVSRSDKPADTRDINRDDAFREGREQDSGADFGQKRKSEDVDDPTLRSRIDISGRSEGNH